MPNSKLGADPIQIFYSYAHEDESLRNELDNHLSLLKRKGTISGWHDRKIGAGTEWKHEIDAHVELAQVILLLISSDFLASDYCYDIELKRAIERHARNEARVVPVILRPCDWSDAPFGKLQFLPKDALPVTKWSNRDEAWLDVVQGIRLTFDDIQEKQIPGVRIHCERPPGSGLLVWPKCEISPRPPSNQEHGTGSVRLTWGESETIRLQPGVEYSISAYTGVPFGGNVALANVTCSVAEREMIHYIYRITRRPGESEYDGLTAQLLRVVPL